MTPASRDSRIDPEHRDWRPLKPRATRRPPEITNPVLEPLWSGTRVLAHFAARPDSERPAWIELIDEEGEEVSHKAPAAAEAVRNSIMALEAVIDGILTAQATAGGEGSALIPEAKLTGMSLFIPRSADVEYKRRGAARAGVEAGVEAGAAAGAASDVAFVAVDLLSLDGQSLLDLPLLERKRLLESLFVASELVRVSPIARPPIRPWFNSWKSAGFRGLMMKGANSRYRPSDFTIEWTIIETLR